MSQNSNVPIGDERNKKKAKIIIIQVTRIQTVRRRKNDIKMALF